MKMEPTNNIDKHIREKLAHREITPSACSWDRLDAMLSVAEKPKKNYGWIYVAAACMGLLLIMTVFFRSSEEMIDKGRDGVVFEVPERVPVESIAKDRNKEIIGNAQADTQSTALAGRKETPAPHVRSSHVSAVATNIVNTQSNQNMVSPDQADQNKSIINQKNGQSEIAMKPSYINVDELLASVDGTAKTPVALTGKSGIRVNPAELLTQVDGELETSFRERVIKGVNKNFQAVKVALANRNHE
jgi:hypothetical protein